MKLLWTSYFCLVLVTVSFWRAFQLYWQSTNDLRISDKNDRWHSKGQDVRTVWDTHEPISPTFSLGDSPDGLFYFIQVSDLHISKFQPKGHTIHFLHFLQSSLTVIKPEFVVVTGDLIDAKDKARVVSAQYTEEWQVYKSSVKEGAPNTPWYDMRGNHDCFDLIGWQAQNNFYKSYGESADLLDQGKGVYSWQVTKEFGEYNFVVADACPKKGPSRPFNFFGYFTTNTMNRLASTILSKKYNHTFLFSHYPITTLFAGISDDGYTLKDLAKNLSMYFCGHLHRLTAGLGDTLKSYDTNTDSLELELSDMKDHGSYRIIAIDHDLISFVDVDLPISQIAPVKDDEIVPLTKENNIIWPSTKIHEAPIVLITNPKESKYILPSKEPLELIRKSTHIRFLVFSEYEQAQMKVRIFVDGVRHPFAPKYVGTNASLPLWTSLWEPNDFDDFETHTIRIEVTAPDGQTGTGDVSFRMDGLRAEINGGFGEWIIWSSISSLLRFLCIFALVAMIMAILVPKIYTDYEDHVLSDGSPSLKNKLLLYVHEIDSGIYQSIYSSIQREIYVWIHRFLQFPQTQFKTWYTCFIFLLALLDLPWFRAEFIPSAKDEGTGYFYLWGLYFSDQQWIPSDTWLFAIFQLTFTVGVFILYFVWKSSDLHLFQCKGVHEEQKLKKFLYSRLWFQLLAVVYLFWRASNIVDLARWYGGIWTTTVLNLLTWWLIAVAVIMFAGKDGIISLILSRNHGAEVVGSPLEICQTCSREQ